MKVRLSRKAEADLESIADWIAKDDPNAAWRFVVELRAQCSALSEMPERHPAYSQRNDEVVRRMAHGNYLIFYTIIQGSVEIVRIIHGAQDHSQFLG